MGSLFAPPPSPSTPKVAPAPEVPEINDAEVEEARQKARKRALAARGRSATILTSGLGVKGKAQVKRNTLLGGDSK